MIDRHLQGTDHGHAFLSDPGEQMGYVLDSRADHLRADN